MDRVWQWAWDRHGTRYSWAVFGVSVVVVLPIYGLTALIIVGFEGSGRHLEAAGIAAAATLTALAIVMHPGDRCWRLMERCAAGDDIDRQAALEATYRFTRSAGVRGAAGYVTTGGLMSVLVAFTAGATPSRVIQWAVVGTLSLGAVHLISMHTYVEAFLQPGRAAIDAGTGIGDTFPRSRPTFATWARVMILATAWVFTLAGGLLSALIDEARTQPVVGALIATGMTLAFGVPITVGAAFTPTLQPMHELAEGTERVAAGDYSRRLPVTQDDDLGVLAASFNRMQAGLAERERLRAAFGSYVDPALASQLLEQRDEIFAGERRDVTVMFVDIRDFTPYAESNTADDAVALLNTVFGMVVPAVLDVGGHVNKYLGDGAMAVFGAPNALPGHADAAVAAAARIDQLVADRFGGAVRIGIGINTGTVIAGTIGGGGKLEFTLIGDTVNVAARVEQLTKTTGDTILMTEATADTLTGSPTGLTHRGAHELKGKSARVNVYALVDVAG